MSIADRCVGLLLYDLDHIADELDRLLDRPAWMADGACREHRELDWIGPGNRYTVAAARAVCAGCDVRAACLDYALADPSLEGIWAATTLYERRRLRHDRENRPSHGP